MTEKIGIYGGSFDPVHLGHVKAAHTAAELLGLTKLIIIPAYVSPLKRALTASPEDRLNMCRMQFPEDKFEISDIEIKRGGTSYTVDTLTELKQRYDDSEFYLLMGSDQLLQFHKWHRCEDIARLAHLAAFSREEKTQSKLLADYCEKNFPKNGYRILEYTPIEISSTVIRQNISEGVPCDGFLSPEVLCYIKEKGLYLGV